MRVAPGGWPQLVLTVVMLVGLLAYLPRALRRRRYRFAVVVLIGVVAAGLWANLHGVLLSR